MDRDNKKQRETHVQLPDANLNETETDELQQQQQRPQQTLQSQQPQQQQLQLELELDLEEGVLVEPRFVNFDWQQLDEAKALVKDMIDYMLPASETEKDAEDAGKVAQLEQATAAAGAAGAAVEAATASSAQSTDARLQHILRLLDCYTRNLEEHVLSVSRGETCTCTELQLTQNCELGTQTLPLNSLRVDVTSTIRPKINARGIQLQQQQQQQQLQQQQQRQPQQQSQQQQQSHSDTTAPAPAATATATATAAPCERRYHTITISANTTSAYAARPRPNTLLGRIGHTLGDFAGAFCLCLQVNKDCVFCLGFFIAFVISASFLTAFFYRTINLTQSLRPSPIDSGDSAATAGNMVTLRFNGGYYYIYNSQRQHFL